MSAWIEYALLLTPVGWFNLGLRALGEGEDPMGYTIVGLLVAALWAVGVGLAS